MIGVLNWDSRNGFCRRLFEDVRKETEFQPKGPLGQASVTGILTILFAILFLKVRLTDGWTTVTRQMGYRLRSPSCVQRTVFYYPINNCEKVTFPYVTNLKLPFTSFSLVLLSLYPIDDGGRLRDFFYCFSTLPM